MEDWWCRLCVCGGWGVCWWWGAGRFQRWLGAVCVVDWIDGAGIVYGCVME